MKGIGMRGVGILPLSQCAYVQGGGLLFNTILGLNPITYWPLNELTGTAAINYGSLGTAANGTYSGVTLNQIDAPGGGRAGLWDGVNDFGNVYSAALAGAFPSLMSAYTLVVFAKTYASATWDTIDYRWIISLRDEVAPTHGMQIFKNNIANRLMYEVRENNVATAIEKLSMTTANWNMYSITVDCSADEFKAYYNAAQEGVTANGINDPNSPVLSATWTRIGSLHDVTAYFWYGYLAHVAIYPSVLTPEQIAAIYAAGGV